MPRLLEITIKMRFMSVLHLLILAVWERDVCRLAVSPLPNGILTFGKEEVRRSCIQTQVIFTLVQTDS